MRPRQYLSWSSLDLFERSKERWVKAYVYDEKLRFNVKGQRGIDLGKKMATALEHDELTGDPMLDLTISGIPKFNVMEMELKVEPEKGWKVPLLSKLDTAKEDLSAFKEYKQGTTEWTQPKVDKFGQITFYAAAIYLKTGRIPEDIELVWVPTRSGDDGRNEVVGDIVQFRTRRTMWNVLSMMARMEKAWEGMEKLTESILI